MWDSKKAEMMQAAHDAELQRVLRRLAQLLFAALLAASHSASQTPASAQRPAPGCAALSLLILSICLLTVQSKNLRLRFCHELLIDAEWVVHMIKDHAELLFDMRPAG